MKKRLLSLVLVVSLIVTTLIPPTKATAKSDDVTKAYNDAIAEIRNSVNPTDSREIFNNAEKIMFLKKSKAKWCNGICKKYLDYLRFKIGNGTLDYDGFEIIDGKYKDYYAFYTSDLAVFSLAATALGVKPWKFSGKNGKTVNFFTDL